MVIGCDKDAIEMLRICHDHAAAKARPQFDHPSTIDRLNGATNGKLTRQKLQKEMSTGQLDQDIFQIPSLQ